jgi:phosphoglucomutase
MCVTKALDKCGFKDVTIVAEQKDPDGNFPTCPYPNPEIKEALALGLKLLEETGADLLLATDPDADRVGVMARTASGEFKTISGNQMGVLLLDYIITAYEENGGLPSDPYAVKTIVSTELATKICAQHGVKLHNVLTGFKFIGEVIKNYEKEGYGSFLLGFEESYGYLKGTYARDKDAVSASLLICEMAAYYKAAGMTLIDALDALYARYGYSFERTEELALDAIHGAEAIKTLMTKLREDVPTEFAGSPVASIGDYMAEVFTDVRTGEKTPTGLPKSNVLYFKTESGDVVVVRPSGTEPKIKFYYLLNGESRTACEAKLEQAKAVIARYTEAL